MKRKLTILGFGGSLRKGSYSKALLHATVKLAPKGVLIETFDLEGIPFYNQDLENGPPEKVKEFRDKIRAADAILVVTPEYNRSIPGFLKNAIDWASRPADNPALEGKPAAIISASTGMLGGAMAQYHLRHCFVFVDVHPVNYPETLVAHVDKKIDDKGRLVDKRTRVIIKELLENLIAWTRQLQSS